MHQNEFNKSRHELCVVLLNATLELLEEIDELQHTINSQRGVIEITKRNRDKIAKESFIFTNKVKDEIGFDRFEKLIEETIMEAQEKTKECEDED